MKLIKILLPTLSVLTIGAVGLTALSITNKSSATNDVSSSPSEPENPSSPVQPIISSNVSDVQIISNVDKFEIQIIGENLVLNAQNYYFENQNQEIKNVEIDLEKSTTSNVFISISDFTIQNQSLNLNVLDSNNINIYSKEVAFGDIKIVDNFDQYVQFLYSELTTFLEAKSKDIKTVEDYINIYNELNQQKYLSITANNGFAIIGNIEVDYKNWSNNSSSMDYSVYFNVRYEIRWNNVNQKTFNRTFSNPDPLNDCVFSSEYVTENGIHFKGNTIISYTGNESIININERYEVRDNAGNRVISSSLTQINDSVFENKNITSLILPNSIKSIGNRTFANNNITNLVFPSSLISIGNEAFQNNKLSSVNFENTNLTTIGDNAFENNLITEVKNWSNTTSIGRAAFKNCKITNEGLNLGGSKITSIGVEAFAYNLVQFNIGGNQTSKIIDLPVNLTTIGVGAFEVSEKIEYFGGADANYDYFRQGSKGSQFFVDLTVINKEGQVRKFITRHIFNIRIVNDVYTAADLDIDRPIYY